MAIMEKKIFINSFGFCLLSYVFKSGLEYRVSSSGKEGKSLQQELQCVCGDLGKTDISPCSAWKTKEQQQ